MNPSSIRYIPRAEIDIEKWDRCIDEAGNGLIYAFSFYLDEMAENWEALVVRDYEAVMPLPVKRRFGIKIWPHVRFVQQLGIMGSVSPGQKSEIINAIILHLTYGDLYLNYANGWLTTKFDMKPRTNFILDLSPPYAAISSRYKGDLINNLKKANRQFLKYEAEEDIAKAVQLFTHHYSPATVGVTAEDYEKFDKLCMILHEKEMVFCRKVTSSEGDILAIGLFLKDKKRIYNIMNTTTQEGRTSEANHLLIDQLIREFSSQPLILDFEGSDLPGVHYFYSKFGPSNQPYFHYHIGAPKALSHMVKRVIS